MVLLALAVAVPVSITSRRSLPGVAPTAFLQHSSARIMVMVSGDVRHPGIYSPSANLMTIDAIKLAVPVWTLKKIIPEGAGLQPLRPGSNIRLTRKVDDSAMVSIESIPVSQKIILHIPLDLKAMSSDDFQQIPGVGPVLAQRITDYRQINGGLMSTKEFMNIEGIGEKKYIQLERYFK